MTRHCGHSTGDDQRLQTFGERKGEWVPKFDRYPLPLPWSCPPSPFSGTCDRSQKTAGPFTKHSASRVCAEPTLKIAAPGRED
ncbi:unnamed protein product, partial [Staurois parvus]